jgi:beta-galactosidase GanA
LSAAPADKTIPHLQKQGSATQLIVDGQPLVMFSGELHNSSSSSLDYMKPIWPGMVALNLNTVIPSISWELVEPEEGRYDFALVDGLIEGAREHHLKLVFIWFATWKNGDATYVPAWVKTNSHRFPRCHHRPGINTTQLTALSEQNVKADAKAFAAVMRHLK